MYFKKMYLKKCALKMYLLKKMFFKNVLKKCALKMYFHIAPEFQTVRLNFKSPSGIYFGTNTFFS